MHRLLRIVVFAWAGIFLMVTTVESRPQVAPFLRGQRGRFKRSRGRDLGWGWGLPRRIWQQVRWARGRKILELERAHKALRD
jgi:hypothetical protein